MDDDMSPDAQVHSSDDEDIGNAHIPKVNLRQDWWKPLEKDKPATPNLPGLFHYLTCLSQRTTERLLLRVTELKPQDLEGPTFELIKVFHPNVIHLQYQMEECHKLLTDRIDDSIIRHNVSKPLPLGGPPGQMKAAYYPDVGLEQMVPDQMWIDEDSYADLSVVRIEVFSIQLVEDFQLGIKSYQTQLNLTKPRWDATSFAYKHDYTVIDSLRAVTFWDRYGVQMIMRFNEIHKFNDGTLHQIDEASDYRVKEFKVNRMNPSLNIRFLTRKDVDKSKEFMFAIQKRLKTSRIFRNLESFVGGRVRDGDYRLLKRIE
nr:hypothetical protein [Tanacetum cinerariifolium]